MQPSINDLMESVKQQINLYKEENRSLRAQVHQLQQELVDLRNGVGIEIRIQGQPVRQMKPMAVVDSIPPGQPVASKGAWESLFPEANDTIAMGNAIPPSQPNEVDDFFLLDQERKNLERTGQRRPVAGPFAER